jgi:hypothetical protein
MELIGREARLRIAPKLEVGGERNGERILFPFSQIHLDILTTFD